MSLQSTYDSHRSGSLYGAFAFGTIVLTCFGGFFYNNRFWTPAEMVPLTFALGAIYVAIGILSNAWLLSGRPTAFAIYYLTQCAVLSAMVFASPSRGFFGMIVLPLASQAIFDLRPVKAALLNIYLFGISIGVWWVDFGFRSGIEAALNYAAAFAFTIAFTIITRRALQAREQSEKLRAELEEANTLLRAQAHQAEDLATTRERNRVAREIHDGVGHYLTVVKTQLDAATALLPAQPERARDAIVKAAKLTGDALDDVRRSVGALRTDTQRPPLPDALAALTADAGLPVAFKIEGHARALPSGVEHALFRSAQEGLTNIRKHSAATQAELTLNFRSDGRVTLTVADNGRGLATAPAANSANAAANTGFGLRGIRERIELLGGRVASGNRSTGGFALNVEVTA